MRCGELAERAVALNKWYTFLSTGGCKWLLEELKARTQSASTTSPVVTAQAFKEAHRALHAAELRWFDLRDYFNQSFMVLGTSYAAVHFMLGHAVEGEARRNVMMNFFGEPSACYGSHTCKPKRGSSSELGAF